MIAPRMKNRRRASLLLLGLCVGFIAVIYFEINDAAPELPLIAPTPAVRNTGKSDASEATFSMPPLRSYADVLLRPLFSQTRRPPHDATTVISSSGFTLVGIVKSSQESHALIEHGKPPHLDRVVEDQDGGIGLGARRGSDKAGRARPRSRPPPHGQTLFRPRSGLRT